MAGDRETADGVAESGLCGKDRIIEVLSKLRGDPGPALAGDTPDYRVDRHRLIDGLSTRPDRPRPCIAQAGQRLSYRDGVYEYLIGRTDRNVKHSTILIVYSVEYDLLGKTVNNRLIDVQ